jgi:hypothetical protein
MFAEYLGVIAIAMVGSVLVEHLVASLRRPRSEGRAARAER